MKLNNIYSFFGIKNISDLFLRKAEIDIKPSYELSENLSTLYEWEYKYHLISQATNMHPKRKENILKLVENGLTHIIDYITDALKIIFKKWLDQHAILDPHKWAETRYQEALDLGYEKDIDYIRSEYTRYAEDNGQDFNDKFIKFNIHYLKDWLELFKSDVINMKSEDLEYSQQSGDNESEQQFIQEIDMITNIDLDNENDLHFFINEYVFNYFDDLSTLMTVIEQSNEYVFKDMCINFMEKITFPLWFDEWSSQGIEDTRNDLEQVYENLETIDKHPISNRIVIINQALNSVHQTGSMLDYINQEFSDVDKKFLDSLSNTSETKIEAWKDDIVNMGVW